MIENDDQGVENTFIDPFAVVSTEGYPFPVEDYIPTEPEPYIPDPDAAVVPDKDNTVIPTLSDNGTVETANGLKVTPEEGIPVEASTFTDTPSDPLDRPEGDEVRISFEEGEETEVDSKLDVLTEIVEIHNQLKEIGGVSKDHITAFEAYYPGVITSQRSLNKFSSIATPVGLEISLESMVDRIVDLVKSIVEWIVRQAKKIIDWIMKRFEATATNNLFDVKTKWTAVENHAKRIDAQGGQRFKNMTGRYPHAAKAATTHHFILLHANVVMKRVFTNFNVGMQAVQKGTMYTEAQGTVTRMSQMREYLTTGVNNFKVGHPVADVNKSVVREAIDVDSSVEYIAKMKANYSELASPTIKEFKNAITVKDIRAGLANSLKTVGDGMAKLQRDITALDEKVAGDANKAKYDIEGLRKVKEGMRIMVSISLEMDVYFQFFTRYCTACMIVVRECDRVLYGLQVS